MRAALSDHVLARVLDIANEADLHRFVFCSTIGTIALGEGRPATEDDAFNWPGVGGPYIESRRQAEDMVLRYARERGLPAVALNVSNPYGPLVWQPNQGLMVKLAAHGQLPVYVNPPPSRYGRRLGSTSTIPRRFSAAVER